LKKKKNLKKKLTFNLENKNINENQNSNNVNSNGLDDSLFNNSYANLESENDQADKNIVDDSFLSQNMSIYEDEEEVNNLNNKLLNKNINDNRINKNQDKKIGQFNQNYILSDEGYENNIEFKINKREENVFEEFKNFRKNQSFNNSRIKGESRKSSINGSKKKTTKNQTYDKNYCFRCSRDEAKNEEVIEEINFANIKYNECNSDVLSYMIYERLFKNNYIYFPESNEYYLTSQEDNLKSVHILVEENLRRTLKNYIICLIPFDQISNINLERFYSGEQVEFFNKIKSEINSNLDDLENLYNLNIENLLKESKNFVDNFNRTFKKNENSKAKFECKCLDISKERTLLIENTISNFSIFAQDTKFISSVNEKKRSLIPPAPKLQFNNLNAITNTGLGKKISLELEKAFEKKDANNRNSSFQSQSILKETNFKVNENSISMNTYRNSKCDNINNSINFEPNFEEMTKYFKDFFHPRILRANNFINPKKTSENTTIIKYNNDTRSKNISNTHLLYSNLAKEFPFEFVLNRKYKTNKKKSEIRIIERENFIIENFHKFQKDNALPKKLKIKNFGNKIYNFDFADKKLNQHRLKIFSEVIDVNPSFSQVKINFKKLNLENHTPVQINMEIDEITHKEEIEKILIETVEKMKRKKASIDTTNQKVSDALKLVSLKLPKIQ